jgi:hypothetical protein
MFPIPVFVLDSVRIGVKVSCVLHSLRSTGKFCTNHADLRIP